MKTNVVALLAKIQAAQNEIMKLSGEVSRHIFYREIEAIVNGPFSFERDGERLAVMVSERDWPMTRTEIIEAFETSGFEFTAEDVEACRPDGVTATNEYRAEQGADYASVYGRDND